MEEQVRRARLMRDAYGDIDGAEVLDAIPVNQAHVIAAARDRGDRGSADWHRGERDWFATHRPVFARGLR